MYLLKYKYPGVIDFILMDESSVRRLLLVFMMSLVSLTCVGAGRAWTGLSELDASAPVASLSTLSPSKGTSNARFEQVASFSTASHDRDTMPPIAPSGAMAMESTPASAVAHHAAIERGFSNLLGLPHTDDYQDKNGNRFLVVQNAPMTHAHYKIQGRDNHVEIAQTGRGANAMLQLSGDANQIRLNQSAPATHIDLRLAANNSQIAVQQRSTGATLILSGAMNHGTVSITQ